MEMPDTKIGVTLYTVRDSVRTPADIAKTLKRVKSMGYENIQLSALGSVDAKELADMIHSEGLHVCATHVAYDRLENDLDNLLEEHRLWGCENLAIGGMPDRYRSEQNYAGFAKDVSPIAQKIRDAGFTFSYHNHSWELERVDGKQILAILIEESCDALFFEIDVYWIQPGGGDPAFWIHRVAGRAPVIHYKDMAIVGREQVMAEVGEGNINWPAVVDACREAGSRWYVVEQDTCAGDPFDSIEISLHNMQAMGL